MKLTSEERKRAIVYKQISQIKGWEEALKVRYAHWRQGSVSGRADPYLTGRADSWEELIELITNSSKYDLDSERQL